MSTLGPVTEDQYMRIYVCECGSMMLILGAYTGGIFSDAERFGEVDCPMSKTQTRMRAGI